jgi:hypothetical protein
MPPQELVNGVDPIVSRPPGLRSSTVRLLWLKPFALSYLALPAGGMCTISWATPSAAW